MASLWRGVQCLPRRALATLTGRTRLRLPHGNFAPAFLVSSQREISKILYADAEDEPLARYLDELRRGDVVYDAGANLGLYAVPAAMKLAALGPGADGMAGEVIAFEPVPEWAARLRQNARANGLTNLTVLELALSNVSGRSPFVLKAERGSGMGSLVDGYESRFPNESWRHIVVEAHRGDAVVAERRLRLPNVIKIDVEGAERRVLEGFGRLLAPPRCRFALVEVHGRFSAEQHGLDEQLTALGFVVTRGPVRGSEYHLFAVAGGHSPENPPRVPY